MDDRFEALVADLQAQVTGEKQEQVDEIRKALKVRLTSEWRDGKGAAVSEALGREVGDDEARRLLFFPDVDDVRSSWAALLTPAAPAAGGGGAATPAAPPPPPGAAGTADDAAAGASAAAADPTLRTVVPALALLYLRHVKEWPLVEAFVAGDGLVPLVHLFEHPNAFLRGQAVDVFLQVTGHDGFDWFAVPRGATALELHGKLLELPRRTAFVRACAETNLPSPVPQGSFFCLQALAFWLSWARLRHTDEASPLTLSEALLRRLRDWGARDGLDEEEAALARSVHDDFARFGTAEAAAERAAAAAKGPKSTGAAFDVDADDVSGAAEAAVESLDAVAAGPLFVSMDVVRLNGGAKRGEAGSEVAPVFQGAKKSDAPPPPPTLEQLVGRARSAMRAARDDGNAKYRDGELEAAVDAYGEAVALAPAEDVAGGKVREGVALELAAAHANRAAALLRLGLRQLDGTHVKVGADGQSEQLPEGEGERRGRESLERALADCDAALALDRRYVKASLRRAQALRGLRRWDEARAAADATLTLAQRESDSNARRSDTNCSADAARAAVAEVRSFLRDMEVERRAAARAAAEPESDAERAIMEALLRRGTAASAAAYVEKGAVGASAPVAVDDSDGAAPAPLSTLAAGADRGGTAGIAAPSGSGAQELAFGQLGEAVDPALGRAAARAGIPDPAPRVQRVGRASGSGSGAGGGGGATGKPLGNAKTGVVGVATMSFDGDAQSAGGKSGGAAKSKGKGKGKGKSKRVVGYGAAPAVAGGAAAGKGGAAKGNKKGKAAAGKVVRLEKALRAARASGAIDSFATELRKIEPAALPDALRESLSEGLLLGIVDALRSIVDVDPTYVLGVCAALPSAARFGTVYAFLPSNDRGRIATLFDELMAAGADAGAVAAARERFR